MLVSLVINTQGTILFVMAAASSAAGSLRRANSSSSPHDRRCHHQRDRTRRRCDVQTSAGSESTHVD
jgi:hypothetical protein